MLQVIVLPNPSELTPLARFPPRLSTCLSQDRTEGLHPVTLPSHVLAVRASKPERAARPDRVAGHSVRPFSTTTVAVPFTCGSQPGVDPVA